MAMVTGDSWRLAVHTSMTRLSKSHPLSLTQHREPTGWLPWAECVSTCLGLGGLQNCHSHPFTCPLQQRGQTLVSLQCYNCSLDGGLAFRSQQRPGTIAQMYNEHQLLLEEFSLSTEAMKSRALLFSLWNPKEKWSKGLDPWKPLGI